MYLFFFPSKKSKFKLSVIHCCKTKYAKVRSILSVVAEVCERNISHSGLCILSIAERQGMKRGWFTYTDLCVLLEQSAWSQALTAIYQHFTKVKRGFELKRASRIFMCLGEVS